jgi:hypothetical protein
MSGVPAAASLPLIIAEIFQNEKVKDCREEDIITFSNVKLSRCQEQKLIFPPCFEPLCVNLLYQTDKYSCECNSSNLQLVAFARKQRCDKHIYAFYFNISNQERFHVCDLRDKDCSVRLSENACFEYSDYKEVFNCVNGRVILLGYQANQYASLQYSECDKYFYEALNCEGILDPLARAAKLTGLSKNLKRFLECKEKKEKCSDDRLRCERSAESC